MYDTFCRETLKYDTFCRETLKYNTFCRKTLKYDTFCRKTLKYGTFCQKILIPRYEPKEMANLRCEPTPHFMPLCKGHKFLG